MTDRIKVLEIYSFLDYDGIERRLERMSRRGWVLQKMGRHLWTYGRAEAKERSWHVCYFRKASDYDPELTEEQRELAELCRRDGWELAGNLHQMMVFVNEREDAPPIDTDPVEEVRSITLAAQRRHLRVCRWGLALALLALILMGQVFFLSPVTFLQSYGLLLGLLAVVLIAVIYIRELAAFYRWRSRAEVEARAGVRSRSHGRGFQIVMTVLALALLAGDMVYIVLQGDRRLLVTEAVGVLSLFAVWAAVDGVRALCRRLRAPKKVSLALTVAAAVILTLALSVVTAGTAERVGPGEAQEDSAGTAQPVLTPEEIWGETGRTARESRTGTVLLRSTQEYFPKGGDGEHRLLYIVYDTDLPFLAPFLRWCQLHDLGMKFDTTSAGRWLADRAYRRYVGGDYMDEWLLFYGDRAVYISLDGEPTGEEKEIIGSRLKGEAK